MAGVHSHVGDEELLWVNILFYIINLFFLNVMVVGYETQDAEKKEKVIAKSLPCRYWHV